MSKRAKRYFDALWRRSRGIVAKQQRERSVAREDGAKLRRWAAARAGTWVLVTLDPAAMDAASVYARAEAGLGEN